MMSSVRLYFLPEYTLEGRQPHHGEVSTKYSVLEHFVLNFVLEHKRQKSQQDITMGNKRKVCSANGSTSALYIFQVFGASLYPHPPSECKTNKFCFED